MPWVLGVDPRGISNFREICRGNSDQERKQNMHFPGNFHVPWPSVQLDSCFPTVSKEVYSTDLRPFRPNWQRIKMVHIPVSGLVQVCGRHGWQPYPSTIPNKVKVKCHARCSLPACQYWQQRTSSGEPKKERTSKKKSTSQPKWTPSPNGACQTNKLRRGR